MNLWRSAIGNVCRYREQVLTRQPLSELGFLICKSEIHLVIAELVEEGRSYRPSKFRPAVIYRAGRKVSCDFASLLLSHLISGPNEIPTFMNQRLIPPTAPHARS